MSSDPVPEPVPVERGPPQDPSVPQHPRTLGDFRIVREIGRGGMGVVYEAEQVSLGRKVALKVLEGSFTREREDVDRFHLEAAAAAQLRHPGILPVYSSGEEAGTHFFAMELADGCTLETILDAVREHPGQWPESRDENVPAAATGDGAASADESCLQSLVRRLRANPIRHISRILQEVASALHHAHQHGILHRDVKPSNVFVRRDGSAALIDFGLAREEGRPELTHTGQLIGTPYYLPPERIQGGSSASDARSDVYSLGVVMYEAVALHPPYDGKSFSELIDQIREADAPLPHRVRAGIPKDLSTICMTAMSGDRDRRYSTAEDLRKDLECFDQDLPIHARPTGLGLRAWKLMRRHAVVSAAALVLLVVSFVTAAAQWYLTKGTVRIESDPPGAQVVIDGVIFPRETPCEASLAPGQHTLSVQLAEHEPASCTLKVERSATSRQLLRLTPLQATVDISSVPTGAEVWLTDASRQVHEPLGIAPLKKKLPKGRMQLQFSMEGLSVQHQDLWIEDTLHPTEVIQRWPTGTLTLDATGMTQDVEISLRSTSFPETILRVEAGSSHPLVLERGMYLPWVRSAEHWSMGAVPEMAIEVEDGGVHRFAPRLQRAKWKSWCALGAGASWVVTGDVDADGRPEVVAATENALVTVIDSHGRTLWSENVFHPIKGLAIVPRAVAASRRPWIAVYLSSGEIVALDGQGDELWRRSSVSNVTTLRPVSLSSGSCDLLVGTDVGLLTVIDVHGNETLHLSIDAPVLDAAQVPDDKSLNLGLVVLAEHEWLGLDFRGNVMFRQPFPHSTRSSRLLCRPSETCPGLVCAAGVIDSKAGRIDWLGSGGSLEAASESHGECLTEAVVGTCSVILGMEGGRVILAQPDAERTLIEGEHSPVVSGAYRTDGRDSVLVGTAHRLVAVDLKGEVLLDSTLEHAPRQMLVIDFDQDGEDEILLFGQDGQVLGVDRPSAALVEVSRSEVLDVRTCPCPQPGRSEIIVQTGTARLEMFHADGTPSAVALLPAPCVALVAAHGSIAFACDNGEIGMVEPDRSVKILHTLQDRVCALSLSASVEQEGLDLIGGTQSGLVFGVHSSGRLLFELQVKNRGSVCELLPLPEPLAGGDQVLARTDAASLLLFSDQHKLKWVRRFESIERLACSRTEGSTPVFLVAGRNGEICAIDGAKNLRFDRNCEAPITAIHAGIAPGDTFLGTSRGDLLRLDSEGRVIHALNRHGAIEQIEVVDVLEDERPETIVIEEDRFCVISEDGEWLAHGVLDPGERFLCASDIDGRDPKELLFSNPRGFVARRIRLHPAALVARKLLKAVESAENGDRAALVSLEAEPIGVLAAAPAQLALLRGRLATAECESAGEDLAGLEAALPSRPIDWVIAAEQLAWNGRTESARLLIESRLGNVDHDPAVCTEILSRAAVLACGGPAQQELAAELWQPALQRKNDPDPRSFVGCARLLRQLGRLEEAHDLLTQAAARIAPDHPDHSLLIAALNETSDR